MMIPDHWLLIATLCGATISLRVVGYLAGAAMMANPIWRRVLTVFPGCLVTALVASALASGSGADWIAAATALATAIVTRNILLTMAVGMATVVLVGALL